MSTEPLKNQVEIPELKKLKTRLQHRGGLKGLYVLTTPNGKIVILTENNRELFAPAVEYNIVK